MRPETGLPPAAVACALALAVDRARPVGVGLGRIRIDDERDLAREIVDDRELLGQEEKDVRNVGELGGRCRCGRRKLRLDMTNGVVTEISGEAPAEARQSGTGRGPVPTQEFPDERKGIALMALDDASPILHFDLPAARADPKLRGQPDERIAAEAFPADHRLEQVGEALVSELEVEREGGIEVRKRLEHERYAVIPKRCESAEFGFGHDAPTILYTNAT